MYSMDIDILYPLSFITHKNFDPPWILKLGALQFRAHRLAERADLTWRRVGWGANKLWRSTPKICSFCLHRAVLHCLSMLCTVLYFSVLHLTALHCEALKYTAQHYTALY